MSTLDDITKEKQWVSEALARVDAQREKLAGELAELEAAERVLARYSKGQKAEKTALTATPSTATKADPARQRKRRRATTVIPAGGKRIAPALGEQVLALADGKTQQEIAAACKGARRTMSASSLPGTSELAASNCATGSSTPRSDEGGTTRRGLIPDKDERRPTPKSAHQRVRVLSVQFARCCQSARTRFAHHPLLRRRRLT
jgi:hypothetical protein